MSAAYVVAKLTDAGKLQPAVEQLTACAAVERWDALDTDAQLVLRVSGNANGLQDTLRRGGLERIAAYDIIGNVPTVREGKPTDARAYLFIDTDPAQKAAIQRTIQALPETISCAAVEGGCDLVALIQSETIAALDKTINRAIRPLDGILRLKHYHAIDLSQL